MSKLPASRKDYILGMIMALVIVAAALGMIYMLVSAARLD